MTIYRVKHSAEEYRKMAGERIQSAEESFERSDTDGFLSQWASGQMANVYSALADLAESGGMASFTYLADLEGELINAKLIPSKFGGSCWMILDENNKATGEFAPYKPVREKTLAKRGYKEIEVERPAVVMTSGGSGLSISVNYYPAEWLE